MIRDGGLGVKARNGNMIRDIDCDKVRNKVRGRVENKVKIGLVIGLPINLITRLGIGLGKLELGAVKAEFYLICCDLQRRLI